MNKYFFAFLLAASLTTVTANAAMIDNFDEETMSADTGFSTAIASTSSTTALSTFGGSRTISITKSGALGANATVIAPPGIYAHSADALTSATSIISWSSALGVDLMKEDLQPILLWIFIVLTKEI